MITEHYEATGSEKAKRILEEFEKYLPLFKKVIPHDYKRMMESIAKHTAEGMSLDEAKIAAFHENTAAKA